jgi:outer membrane protein OmpA-like peptidoglycan-associated protein
MAKFMLAAAAALLLGTSATVPAQAQGYHHDGRGYDGRGYVRGPHLGRYGYGYGVYPYGYYGPRRRHWVYAAPYGYWVYDAPPVAYYPPAYPPAPLAAPARDVRPAPPPPPRPAAAAKDFIVYFPFDSEVLTPQAKQVIAEAARYQKQLGGPSATIVGYTDAAGSEGYNQALSERRSQVVRQDLLAQGVRDGAVEMAWKGKHDLAVKTPDGVKEPANRRVTIVIGGGADRASG